jgi:AcrR family transcriptional regulator
MSVELRVPVQARSVRTRGDLVEAARKEFSARGYALSTAKSIAARARVGTGTFYHYFPDKDAVLREIVAQRMETLEHSLSSNTLQGTLAAHSARQLLEELRRRLRQDIERWIEYHRSDLGLHAVVSERRLCDPALDAIMRTVEQRGIQRTAEALARWGHQGDAEATAFMLFSLMDGAVHNHVLGQATLSDARFTDALTHAILQIGVPVQFLGELSAR